MTTLKVSSPAELISVVPFLVGFHPADSLTVVAMQGPKVTFAVRVDLPERDTPDEEARAAVLHLASVVLQQQTEAVTIIGYGDEPRVTPAVLRISDAFRKAGLTIVDELRVAEGRYWSYLCTDKSCCPEEGQPCEPSHSVVAAEATFAGAVALPSREALAAQLAPAAGDDREAMLAATARAVLRLAALAAAHPPAATASQPPPATGSHSPAATASHPPAAIASHPPAATGSHSPAVPASQPPASVALHSSAAVASHSPDAAADRAVEDSPGIAASRADDHLPDVAVDRAGDRPPGDAAGRAGGDSESVPTHKHAAPPSRSDDLRLAQALWDSRGPYVASGESRVAEWGLGRAIWAQLGLSSVSTAEADRGEKSLALVPDEDRFFAQVRREGRKAVREAEHRYCFGGRLTDDEAAWLGVLLLHMPIRDYAWTRTRTYDWEIALWSDLTRRVEPRYTPAPAALLAFVAWRAGMGPLASIAVERALDQNSDYTLAVLLQDAINIGLPPASMDGWPAINGMGPDDDADTDEAADDAADGAGSMVRQPAAIQPGAAFGHRSGTADEVTGKAAGGADPGEVVDAPGSRVGTPRARARHAAGKGPDKRAGRQRNARRATQRRI